jgi:hypothetical protein
MAAAILRHVSLGEWAALAVDADPLWAAPVVAADLTALAGKTTALLPSGTATVTATLVQWAAFDAVAADLPVAAAPVGAALGGRAAIAFAADLVSFARQAGGARVQ